jgi:hypothetical protein
VKATPYMSVSFRFNVGDQVIWDDSKQKVRITERVISGMIGTPFYAIRTKGNLTIKYVSESSLRPVKN